MRPNEERQKKDTMKIFVHRIILSLAFCFALLPVFGQQPDANDADSLLRISGKIFSMSTKEFLNEAEIHTVDGNASTMSNEDGYFILKCSKDTKAIAVNALGYRQEVVAISSLTKFDNITIFLRQDAQVLQDVWVFSADNIVESALKKIEVNYPSEPMLYRTFYRETVKKKRRYVCVIEAVQDVYKKPYSHANPDHDRVFVEKGRRLLSENRKDTISVHVEGGPNEALYLDLVKNREFLLNEDFLRLYSFSFDNTTTIGDRMQYVVSFRLAKNIDIDYSYSGRMFIDASTLAFTRLELSLDCSDKDKATSFMLRRKPFGLRFKPKSLLTTINYYYDGNKSHVNYIRNEFQFGCDWKKKGLYTQYVVTSENLVTHRERSTDKTPHRPSFSKYDVLDKKVGNFADPEFWKNYNILEPSESLENAVRKLMKRAGE